MEITVNLKVKPETLFDYLVDEVAKDIQKIDGISFKMEDLQTGYSYTKILKTKNGSDTKVTVEINSLTSPEIYQASIYGPSGVNTVSYELTRLEGDSTKLTYKESFKSNSVFGTLNYILMSLLYSSKSKKYMKEMLLNLEQQLLSNKV